MTTLKRTQLSTLQFRNIGISAHVDAGKTTLTERILYFTGRQHSCGDVDQGTTTTDFTAQEQQHGITIQAAAVSCTWADCAINLIDTPGHVDFSIEVERSMRVLDGTVVVVCAKGGVQPQTRTVWRQADRNHVPRIVFINKMDSLGADFARVTEQLRRDLQVNLAVLQLPIGSGDTFRGVVDLLERKAMCWSPALSGKPGEYSIEAIPDAIAAEVEDARAALVEQIIASDDALLERYFAGEPVSVELLQSALRRATIRQHMVPVLCGSAFRSIAVQPVLDAVCTYLPSPAEANPIRAIDKNGIDVTLSVDEKAKPLALAFKVVDDPHGDLVFLRIYRGTVRAGSYMFNPRLQRNERVSRLVKLQGAQHIAVDELRTGDIGAAIGLKATITGDTLCTQDELFSLERISCPAPVISLALEPAQKIHAERLEKALRMMQKADPSFTVGTDHETGQIIISGMGELHLQIKQEILADLGVQTRAGDPQVSYREVPTRSVTSEHTHRQQSGGPGQYARVIIEIEPGADGSGFQFIDRVTNGAIPKQFITSVEKGISESLGAGPVDGYPITDVTVTLLGGQTHPTDSNDVSFKIAGSMAFKDAFARSQPVLIEPVMSLHVQMDEEYIGAVIRDVGQRGGRVLRIDSEGKDSAVHAEVALSQAFRYASSLRNFTRGTGTFSMEFLRYERTK